MELHQAMVNMERGGSADGLLQVKFCLLPTMIGLGFYVNVSNTEALWIL